MQKLRVLEVIRDAEGGMKTHVETLLTGIDKNRFYVVLACSAGQFDNKKLVKSGIKTYQISLGDRRGLFALAKSLSRLVQIIKGERIQVLHAHGTACAVICTSASILARGISAGNVRVITTIHNFPDDEAAGVKKRLSYFLFRVLIKRSHRVVAVSHSLGNYIISKWNLPEDKVEVIHNGIDPPILQNTPAPYDLKDLLVGKEKPVVILNISRLIPQKGVDTFIKAASILLRNRLYRTKHCCGRSQKLLFLIAGSGPQEHVLKKMARDQGLERHVIFLGYRNDIYNLIKCADVVVLSSRSEGLGLSILEAMAAQKPVIATCVGGIPEIISHGENGLLVRPDDPEGLARAISYLLANPRKAEIMAEAGRMSVTDRFSMKKMLTRLEHLYETANRPLGGTGRGYSI